MLGEIRSTVNTGGADNKPAPVLTSAPSLFERLFLLPLTSEISLLKVAFSTQ